MKLRQLYSATFFAMFGISSYSKSKRLVIGIVVLLVVDVIWVASSEVTKVIDFSITFFTYQYKKSVLVILLQHVFPEAEYTGRPYFSTYLKTSMFLLYLSGFLCWKNWWKHCKKTGSGGIESSRVETEMLLSEPVFVPVKFDAVAASVEDRLLGTSDYDSEDPSSSCKNLAFRSLTPIN